jgi:hypothetical protein
VVTNRPATRRCGAEDAAHAGNVPARIAMAAATARAVQDGFGICDLQQGLTIAAL